MKCFRGLSVFLASGLILGACSPLAPNVSKLTSAAGQNSTPTNGSSPSENISVAGNMNSLVSAKPLAPQDGQNTQKTVVISQSRFDKSWTAIHRAKPSFELDVARVGDFILKGDARFPSEDDRVTGHEPELVDSKATIYLVVDTGSDEIKDMHLDEVKTALIWKQGQTESDPASDAHWELSITGPDMATMDPASDSDAEQVQKTLKKHLLGAAVAFGT